MFAHSRTETSQTDIVLTLTPHIVRLLDVSEEDLRAFRVDGEGLAPIADLPVPADIPPPTTPPAVPPPAVPPAAPPAPALPGAGATPPPG
jgi:hypothetical protein